ARFPDQKYQEALRTFLLSKYGDRRIDLIVADGDTSLDFLTRSRDLLFPGTPIAFVGRGPHTIANATGVIAPLNFRATLDMALRVQPDTERVVIVSGGSAFDTLYESMARGQ